MIALLDEIFHKLMGACPDQDDAIKRLAYSREQWLDSYRRSMEWQRQMALARPW